MLSIERSIERPNDKEFRFWLLTVLTIYTLQLLLFNWLASIISGLCERERVRASKRCESSAEINDEM